MSRKDTILVAVLINAGLLVVLFASALKQEPAPVERPVVRQQIEVPAKKKKPVLKKEEPKTPIAKAPAVEAKPKPAPKALEPVKPAVELKKVVVQSGDALEKLARRHGVSVTALMHENNLTSSQLKIGQELVIPKGGKAPAKTNNPKYYEVRAGDSPWTIASKNKIKLEELLSLNDLDEASAKKLKPGDKLRIE